MATGRAVPEKGLDRLLFAVKELLPLPGWRLVIDSDGPELKDLKNTAQKLGLADRVEFAGWLPGDQHEALFRKSSVVVVPSVWPEPFGLVGIEAMSYAKPVVAFAVGGIPEWLKDKETGFLVCPYNVKEMAGKISTLIRDPEKAAAMGQSGLSAASQNFSAAIHLQKLLDLYAELIKNSSLQSKGA